MVTIGRASRDFWGRPEQIGFSVEFDSEPLSWVAFLLDVEVGVGGWCRAVWLDGGACLA
jgi:hypothetical protein